MKYWLIKSEPNDFSWSEQVAKGAAGETWDGVRNHQAAAFLREMKVGDQAFFYHSGKERQIVGTVEITRAAYPDPTDASGRFVAVTVRALKPLAEPVTLSAIKAEPTLAEWRLVRNSRLSVMPVSRAEWQRVQRLSRGS